jgi:hypothetical protein
VDEKALPTSLAVEGGEVMEIAAKEVVLKLMLDEVPSCVVAGAAAMVDE